MTDEHGRTLVDPPPEPWTCTSSRLLGDHCTLQTRLGPFTAEVSGHVGSADWVWRVMTPDESSATRLTMAHGGANLLHGALREEQAREAALAMLATALYVDSL